MLVVHFLILEGLTVQLRFLRREASLPRDLFKDLVDLRLASNLGRSLLLLLWFWFRLSYVNCACIASGWLTSLRCDQKVKLLHRSKFVVAYDEAGIVLINAILLQLFNAVALSPIADKLFVTLVTHVKILVFLPSTDRHLC